MFEAFIEKKQLGGINCLIWQDGQDLFQASYGYLDPVTQEPMTPDALFRISSMTKPVTSVIAMMLVEEQKLDLNDPISRWFPQFEEMSVWDSQSLQHISARKAITILDLLTHRAGFTYGEFQQGPLREAYRKLGGDIDTELSNEQWVAELANLPLVSQPGERFQYGRSTDLLGILISTIEGKTLGEVMQEKLFAPLGMSDTFFVVPPEKRNRRVANIGFNDAGECIRRETVPLQMALNERPAHYEFQSGGQGLWSTMGDYLTFARIFTDNGSPGGTRILRPQTIDWMCTNQLTPQQREQSILMGAPIFQESYGFGLGLAMVSSQHDGSIPCSGSVGSVGWPGAYGGWWSADRNHQSIAIFLTHSMTQPEQLASGIGFELYDAIDVFATHWMEMIK